MGWGRCGGLPKYPHITAATVENISNRQSSQRHLSKHTHMNKNTSISNRKDPRGCNKIVNVQRQRSMKNGWMHKKKQREEEMFKGIYKEIVLLHLSLSTPLLFRQTFTRQTSLIRNGRQPYDFAFKFREYRFNGI